MYGKMTAAQLRTVAEGLGLTPPKFATKGRLLNDILKKERADSYTAAQAEQDALPQDADSPGGAYVPNQDLSGSAEPKGAAKAAAFAGKIEEAGWATKISTRPGGGTEALSQRGAETIEIVWYNGVITYGNLVHVIGDRTVKLRNVSHALQIALRTAEEAHKELARVANSRAFRPASKAAATATAGPRKVLPFGSEAPAEEISKAVLGKRIVWQNRISGAEESAIASGDPRWVSVREAAGERVLQFCSANGFRACRLSAIVRVGGRK
jgi:hypothetical protein